MAVAVLPLMLTVSATRVQRRAAGVLLLYSLNVTVSLLLGLTRPVTVAVSLIDSPT